ncbi:hypothetical protein NAPIS_ORF00425 [Vairimorpha apis BRL 01]|uniref:Uncharacterized protein n=1 Tax=Vairimorpha apis BRL 01 TaxID=1037528 RepID=T0LCG0_9MICR|nr:hypothetical protein NAPIS_ORF00425 [Vairimorpha apis BRL 01]
MNIITKTKIKALKTALLKRKTNLIIIHGPSGCLKTSFIKETCASLNLQIEYIDNILQYKSKLVLKNSVGLTDLDDFDYFIKYKSKICNITNLIIETRCLPYIYKYIPSSICINLNKLTIKQLSKLNIKECDDLNLIRGNLHRLTFYKYSHCIPSYNIYKYLNFIYSFSYNTSDNVDNKPDDNQLLNKYIFYNSLYLIDFDDLYNVYNVISLCDSKLQEFDEYLIYIIKTSKKNNIEGFYNFKII